MWDASPTVQSNRNVELPPQNVCLLFRLQGMKLLLCRQVEQLQDSLSGLSIQQRPVRIIRCYICNQTGHHQDECRLNVPRQPKMIYCVKLSRPGHVAARCPVQQAHFLEPVLLGWGVPQLKN